MDKENIAPRKMTSSSQQQLLLYANISPPIHYRTLQAYDFQNDRIFVLAETESKHMSTLIATKTEILDIGGTRNFSHTFLHPDVKSVEYVEIFTSDAQSSVQQFNLKNPRIYASGVGFGDNKAIIAGGDFWDLKGKAPYMLANLELIDYSVLQNPTVKIFDMDFKSGNRKNPKYFNFTCGGIANLHNKVYLAGGFLPPPLTKPAMRCESSNKLFEIEQGGAGAKRFRKPMIHSRSCFRLISIENKLIAIGGNCGDVDDARFWNQQTFLDSVERYDPETDDWEPLASLNDARQHFGIITLNNKIHVIGGNSKRRDELTIEAYDPQKDKWDYVEWPRNLSRDIDFGFSTPLPIEYDIPFFTDK